MTDVQRSVLSRDDPKYALKYVNYRHIAYPTFRFIVDVYSKLLRGLTSI